MIKQYINKLPERKPADKLTGNIFKLFPELLTFPPLEESHRINYVLTPTVKSWYFMYKDKPFNFYPIFLHLTSQATKINYTSISYKLSISQAANIHYKQFKKY